MVEKLGGLFGWFLILAFAGTIMNYCLKFVNKRFSKRIAASPAGKKIMKNLMNVFVRNHKYVGFSAAVLLLAHFMIQYTRFGINITGCIAAIIMIFQVLSGAYANKKKLPRKGAWFAVHRATAVLIIFGIAIHLVMPNILNAAVGTESIPQKSEALDTSELQTFTMEELSKYNGENGNRAYVAYQGLVYDVTDIPAWNNGTHHGHRAGTDVTEAIKRAPHGTSKLENLEVVGVIN